MHELPCIPLQHAQSELTAVPFLPVSSCRGSFQKCPLFATFSMKFTTVDPCGSPSQGHADSEDRNADVTFKERCLPRESCELS